MTQIQILHEAILFHTNTLGKGMNQSVPFTTIGK